ncbi:MAG TPA: cytochrome c [Candidatus Eisenbacteria bacterium]|nr:cytochrome c [Candidatus Eisenbacteria bacterium]
MKRNLLWSLVLLGAMSLAGCGGGGGGGTSSGTTPSSPLDVGPRAADSPVNAELAAKGEALFKSKTCSTCHAFGARITGPDLVGVTHRRTEAWMRKQMLQPEVMTKEDPIARQLLGQYAVQMPNLMLKNEEVDALIHYIKQKDQAKPATQSAAAP